ncbi:hypothetical protein [Tichowtungia aerotolerans]|uniref:Uncharacterized protein n=1 Tax=Tichowtungia aerotolerans TaxID=2697043 RepID=A0A6P1M2N6_9BACT|nr:hypothetical protein [Tichowtungia aerotolerans]QHI68860.1 hypothetical protein GT409_05140 [Tichowtungia aerotolerans]
MIDQQAAWSRSSRLLWAGHLQRLFETLELQEHRGAAEISQSLAAFCEQHSHMSDSALSLLMARSFCATGDRDAAIRILQHDHVHRPHTDLWVDVLSAEYPFPELYALFSSRVLRPFRLATVGRQATWILDLGQIRLPEAARHEIIFLKTLRVLTEKISNVWKKPNGQGTLVVKGCPRLMGFVQPMSGCSPSEITGYIQDVLCGCARRNRWASVPSVLLLDL